VPGTDAKVASKFNCFKLPVLIVDDFKHKKVKNGLAMVGRSCHNHASWSSHLQQMRSHRRLGSVHQWLLRWTWPAPSAKSRKGFMLQGCKNDPTLAHTHILGKGQTHGTFLNGITGI